MAQTIVEDRPREKSGRARGSSPQPPVAARRGAGPRGPRVALERVVLGILTTLVSVNLWTGGPLFALWVGSRIQSAVGELSMAAVGATVGVLVVETIVLYRILALLNARYNAIIGRVLPRQQAPWMKPTTGERRAVEVKRPLSATERIVVASAVVAVLAFEVWFFFFAHYTFAS